MTELSKIISRIESALNLLKVSVDQYKGKLGRQDKFALLIDSIQEAREHAQQHRVDRLHGDIEWMATTIFTTPLFKKEFENTALKLQLLNRELGKFILTIAFEDKKDTISTLFLSVQHDLEEINERALRDITLRRLLAEYVALEKSLLKKMARPIRAEDEREFIQDFSHLSQRLKGINVNVSTGIYADDLPMQALRKVLLHDWNMIVKVLKDTLARIYQQKIAPQGLFLSFNSAGVQGFEIRN